MFGRRITDNAVRSIELDSLITSFGRATSAWDSQTNLAPLVQARLADNCRDAKLRPVSRAEFQQTWQVFDEEHQGRFCILLGGLELPDVVLRAQQVCGPGQSALPVLRLLHQLTEGHPLLTSLVLQQSDIRLEELARHFCARWGLPIQGETPKASAARLHEIDFGRLMKEAEAARASADDRLAYLKQLQEEQDKTRRPRRGKW